AQTENEVFSFKDKAWTITRIRKADDILVLPYSGGGIVASCFNPDSLLPANIKEIYIGKNIKSLGTELIGLRNFAPNVEAVFVDGKNTKLKSHLGVVYTKSGELIYIPGAMKSVELLPVKVMEKNYVVNHNGMEEVILPNGTEELQDYAFENCPNLKRAYIPENTKVSERAFYSVHADFQIIRGNITGIPEITM
ncbi:MAG: leucine-rich repeat protein, partial [Bacteroidaceae bacterium]|nr:leucine-rich repeat protein [Bacteroidaceae bacterium]